jgi:hypothetical protein
MYELQSWHLGMKARARFRVITRVAKRQRCRPENVWGMCRPQNVVAFIGSLMCRLYLVMDAVAKPVLKTLGVTPRVSWFTISYSYRVSNAVLGRPCNQ